MHINDRKNCFENMQNRSRIRATIKSRKSPSLHIGKISKIHTTEDNCCIQTCDGWTQVGCLYQRIKNQPDLNPESTFEFKVVFFVIFIEWKHFPRL